MTIRKTHITHLATFTNTPRATKPDRMFFLAIFKDVYGEQDLGKILWANKTGWGFTPITPTFTWMGCSWYAQLMREINKIAMDDALKNKPTTWI